VKTERVPGTSEYVPREDRGSDVTQAPRTAQRRSLVYMRGFAEGAVFRRSGRWPPQHVLIGIDEYSLAFRAGFFERR
jgi:hypothetical protein